MMAYHHAERLPTVHGAELDRRLAAGWFRMHQDIFTTTHLFTDDEFHRVHWLRYEVDRIQDRASHRRIRKLNAVYRVTIDNFNGITGDHAELFARYRASINFDGANSIAHALFDDGNPDENPFHTKRISIHDGNRLIAGGYFDIGATAGTSILHFFDPDYRRFSLGRFMMLVTIDYLHAHGYTLYYPGYVVSGKAKMNYKLFLGRDLATYFDPITGDWLPFDERILEPERLNEIDKLQLAISFLG